MSDYGINDIQSLNFFLRYKAMMQGNVVDFSEEEIIDMLMNLDYYHINTLMIQTNLNKSTETVQWFTCKVDEPTVKIYIRE